MLGEVYDNVARQNVQLQSGHSWQMEEDIYGRRGNENPFSNAGQKGRFRKVSQAWHRFLRFPSAMDQQEELDTKERVRERWRRIRRVDPQTKLREMYGEGARFRGQQKNGLKVILGGAMQVVVVMGTGSGKSLLYMLPATCSEGGLTVLVVPIVALQDDQARRCQEAGLRVAVWGGGVGSCYSSQVVIVTPESAVTKTFGRFLGEKVAGGELERIVIDECHVVLDSMNGWREKMLKLKEMGRKGCQIVFLTATLSPSSEEEWMAAMEVDKEAVWVRESTSRGNIEYSLKEYDKQEEGEEVQQLVKRKMQQYREGVVLVYCSTVQQCQEVAGLLRCPAYFREVGGSV